MAEPVLQDVDMNAGNASKSKKGKRLSVERIYQKKTQLEHILLRPDTYVGSTEPQTQSMWIWNDEEQAITQKNITFVPGLYKIFDEILVNAADNKQRDRHMNAIKINIDQEKNTISVWNNGKGIPVEMHKEQQVYVPTLIFGQLLTSSNYDDDQKKVTGGRNGYGAKLCNIFSTKFSIETACGDNGKHFKQVWRNNMGKAEEPTIKQYGGTDFTCVTFSPDLKRFKMDKLDDDTVALLKKRAYDIAGATQRVSVYLNGTKLKVSSFRSYVDLYLKGAESKKNKNKNTDSDNENDEEESKKVIVHEIVNPRWEICVTTSDTGFQQASFVNSIATTKGGTHVNYIADQIVEKMITAVKRKVKGGIAVKPYQIKNHMWIFINCLIENPSFDSQTKENMTLRAKSFGSACDLSDKFIKSVQNCGLMEQVMNWVKFKTNSQMNKKLSATKSTKIKGVPKLDDANDAGGRNSKDCTLILTEGDSAKSLAVSGLGVIGRDKYGVFPLRGKLLNVRDATHKQIMENAEITNIVKIVGLQYNKKYPSAEDLKSLRYGSIMIMTDQDQDGSHIKGLIINFIHHNWPNLLRLNFLKEFITPIVKVTKGKEESSFYSLPEFEEWKQETPNAHTWKIKYYKGLGTSTAKEAKEYFSDLSRHKIGFNYDGPSCDEAIKMAFSKKMVADRKTWLQANLEEKKRRNDMGMPEAYLYHKNTKRISYTDFVNKELILFSNMDNVRSIPSIIDGLKPGQRKVMFTCFKRNDKKEVKVAQLAGSVAEKSAYHHGEASLMGTIINLAQNFVGSNNINLLQPIGQFGTRLLGGKDSAQPRYITTMLSALAKAIFISADENVLNFQDEDNQIIEPVWYCPIIPMVLVNGAEGIGTGYSTKVPNYNPREIVANLKRKINGEEFTDMVPWYKGFIGDVSATEYQRYCCSGVIGIVDDSTIEITELPIRTWTQAYKESVLEPFLYGNDKTQPFITDYKEYHTDNKVHFIVKMTPENLALAEQEGLYKKFKLESSMATSCMVGFDANGCLRKYENVTEIMEEFYAVRANKYVERKAFLVGAMEAEALKLKNQARFILEKIEKKIFIENRKKKDLIEQLVTRGFDSDPLKAWKSTIGKSPANDDQSETSSVTSNEEGGPDYGYLVNMSLLSLTKEKVDELLKNRDTKLTELAELKTLAPQMIWEKDLDNFIAELDRMEEEEKNEDKAAAKKKGPKGKVAPVYQSTIVERQVYQPKQPKPAKEPKVAKSKSTKAISIDSSSTASTEAQSGVASVTEVEDAPPAGATLTLAQRMAAKKGKGNAADGKKKQTKLAFTSSSNKLGDETKKTAPLSIESENDSDNSDVAATKKLIEKLSPKKPSSSETAASKEPVKKNAAKQLSTAPSTSTKRPADRIDSLSFTDDSDDDMPKLLPKKKQAKKAPAKSQAAPKKTSVGVKKTQAPPKDSKRSKKSAVALSSDESDIEITAASPSPIAKKRGRRKVQSKKYTIDSDSEDEVDDFSPESEDDDDSDCSF